MRRLSLIGIALVCAVVVPIGSASAKSPPPTKIRFRLDSHEVALGDEVTGSVRLTGGKKLKTPIEGAALSVRVDGAEVGTLTTDAAGEATVSYVAAAAGEHSIKVVYVGDSTHRKAKAAQGFEVCDPDCAVEEEVEDEDA